MKRFFVTLLLFIPLCLGAQDFAAYAAKVAKEWNIPGSALAVVKDGKTVFSQGFGVKRLGGDQTISPESVFQIGSVTKSFTATLMAMLVEDSLVRWDDPVREYLPDFQMHERCATDDLQIRDLFLHRTGLPGQGGTFIPCLGYDRDDLYGMFKYMPLAFSPRTTYAYNNITFLVAARIIEDMTGKTWEDNVRERIFEPLGMTHTSVNESGFLSGADGNTPHASGYQNGKLTAKPLEGEEMALYWETIIGPAGGINSTVTDMLQWCRFQLSDGTVDGNTLLSPASMEYLHRGQIITSQSKDATTIYAPGWFVEQNNKYRIWFHTGTTWGFSSLCAFVPDLNLGLVWLSNCEAPSAARYAIMRRIIDSYLKLPAKDYSTESLKSYLAEKKATQEREALEAKTTVQEVSAPYYQYEGTYTHPAFGNAIISQEAGDLYISLGPVNWEFRTHVLTHKNAHTFTFRAGGAEFTLRFIMEGDRVTFDLDLGGDENMGLWRAVL